MKIVISGGGTGGHFYPAMAVLEAFERQGHQVSYVGAKRGIEAEKVAAFTPHFQLLELSGLLGHRLRYKLHSLWQLSRAVSHLRRHFRSHRPDAVLGFGGYASAAAIVAARLCGIPTFLHEQNARAGLTNTVLDRFTTASFSAYGNLGENMGLPLRATAFHPLPSQQRSNLLIMGGSQGSLFLNTFVLDYLPHLTALNIDIYHQAGAPLYDEFKEQLHRRYGHELPEHYHCFAFRDDIHEIMAHSSIALSRSGAGAVFELMSLQVPTVFIPFPAAAHDHQYHNALFFEQRGCAMVHRQEEFLQNPMQIINRLRSHKEEYHEHLRQLSLRTSPDELAHRVLQLLPGR
ncbi:UDP-N-acetylglucosamine--N-acetylmuramyl-(pentapeptide) pyrophosphoryl-undecaprenol N-acetylglucosamine transferase [Desulfurispira natronophila]|uniref:UDP-N-acetylglucosamine--N-acetylmuramyl-(pentapeptide) pyrophosphoryl-undecaprenol N-acetylglucosamine transferase n=1 Tax=Desulfurispira natronophila TaxID=682562 RepID=A0A7W7Y5E1_9BACT|nr:UDP-N-acetylglucosamine--N-acetylmuramyl-(pentapeptide) pyrophosphoryl-undecaprenol N-acetylglucosamine transferase [Desulfurispira natronophila]MBB5022224.1 UDP-N-acetylglucosamine--N-acetylmuramyl-(pentapeptide) pyrophosphoryl-undecaprenol N-acetylglucosamine transferase [Desulfurispira natronophila]